LKLSAVAAVFERAKPTIAAHWSRCIQAGLSGFAPSSVQRVDDALAEYFAAVDRPGIKQVETLHVMQSLFARLDEINGAAGGSLLETDERELLVPIILDAAEAAGLDLTAFEDGDPTLIYRNF